MMMWCLTFANEDEGGGPNVKALRSRQQAHDVYVLGENCFAKLLAALGLLRAIVMKNVNACQCLFPSFQRRRHQDLPHFANATSPVSSICGKSQMVLL